MRRRRLGILVLGLHAVLVTFHVMRQNARPPAAVAPPVLAPTESPLRDRFDFARRLREVKVGMSRSAVRELLGDPDDIWIGDEANARRRGSVFRKGNSAWTYGGEGHLTFPTLGKVSFGADGKVVEIAGIQDRYSAPTIGDERIPVGTPVPIALLPAKELPAEPDVRRILRLIDRLKGYEQYNDPLRVIQVVNALQPLGKDGALAVIDEYLRASDGFGLDGGREGLFVVVRCLFEIPDPPGYFPEMAVGAPSPEPPPDARRSPRFPVVLYRDIPFVGINGYSLGGMPEPIEMDLDEYRAKGRIRSVQLRPPDNPLAIIDDLVTSTEWPDWKEQKDWGKSVAREQVLRLVDPAYRVDESQFDQRLTGYYPEQDTQWRTHLRRFASLHAHWDPKLNTYVRPDGSFSPPRPEPYTYPRVWHAKIGHGEVEVSLQRHHRKGVSYWISGHDLKPPMARLRMFAGGSELQADRELRVPTLGSMGSGFDLPENSDVRLVLEQDGKVVAETVLRP